MTNYVEYANIQVQDLNGNWFIARTLNRVTYQQLINEMEVARSQFGGTLRVKATAQNGSLIDIL